MLAKKVQRLYPKADLSLYASGEELLLSFLKLRCRPLQYLRKLFVVHGFHKIMECPDIKRLKYIFL